MTNEMTSGNHQKHEPWSLGTPAPAEPYLSAAYAKQDRSKPYNNVLELVGQTPMVRLNRIPTEHGLRCKMYAKLEYFNPGGSVKDRIAVRMLHEAEKRGDIKPGDTIIEPTSGNTGIGLALSCAVYGYKCVIVLPQKMSQEKVNTLKALGVEIIRTPTHLDSSDENSHIGVAKRLNKEIPNSYILNQYDNPFNVLAHYDQTAEEIDEQLSGEYAMVVCGAGTGGTITGIGRKLKEKALARNKAVTIIGADPVGSIISENGSLLNEADKDKTIDGSYKVEGIGYDFIPTIMDFSVIDGWVKTTDEESLTMARKIIRKEGILAGGSSGAALSAALKAAKDLGEDETCVVVFPDGVRNYMTKFLSDDWMQENMGEIDIASLHL